LARAGKLAQEVLAGERELKLVRHKKGKRQEIDLAPHLEAVKFLAEGGLELKIGVLGGRNPNIFVILQTLAGLEERPDRLVVARKLKSFMRP
jgi:hypothetical protein